MKSLRIPAAGALALVLLAAAPALAQTSSTVVDLKPLIELGFEILKVVMLALAGALATYLTKHYGAKWSEETKAKVRDTLRGTVQSGVQLAQAKLSTEDIEKVDVQNAMLAIALRYAVENGADAAKKLGVDVTTVEGRRALSEKIESEIAPSVIAGAATPGLVTVAQAASIANPPPSMAPVVPAPAVVVPPATT